MKRDLEKKGKGFFNEFKKFIMRGNVMDMAVGVIVGGAFTSIVTSLNQDILTPILGIFGGTDFSNLMVTLGDKFIKKEEEEKKAPTTKICPYCKSTIAIEAVRCPHCTSSLEEK